MHKKTETPPLSSSNGIDMENIRSEGKLQIPQLRCSIEQDKRDIKKTMEDFVNEARDFHEKQNYGLNYREKTYEDLMQEVDDIQHSPSLLSSAYTTHEEEMFPSQSQNKLEFIYEVEVQDEDLPNVLE